MERHEVGMEMEMKMGTAFVGVLVRYRARMSGYGALV